MKDKCWTSGSCPSLWASYSPSQPHTPWIGATYMSTCCLSCISAPLHIRVSHPELKFFSWDTWNTIDPLRPDEVSPPPWSLPCSQSPTPFPILQIILNISWWVLSLCFYYYLSQCTVIICPFPPVWRTRAMSDPLLYNTWHQDCHVLFRLCPEATSSGQGLAWALLAKPCTWTWGYTHLEEGVLSSKAHQAAVWDSGGSACHTVRIWLMLF